MPNRGHYKPDSKRKEVVVSIRMREEDVHRLEAVAAAFGKRRSDMARTVIERYLDVVEPLVAHGRCRYAEKRGDGDGSW